MQRLTAFKIKHDYGGTHSGVGHRTKHDGPVGLPGNCSQPHAADFNGLQLSIHRTIEPLEKEWRQLEKHSNITIYQRYDWIEACIRTIDNQDDLEPLFVTGRIDGALVLLLPLTIKQGLIQKISWIGKSHSNYNLPLLAHDFASGLEASDIISLFSKIGKLLPSQSYLKLCCQPVLWQGQHTPLIGLPHQRSTNIAFGMDLTAGIEGVLAAGNAKRKRKKFRSQTRIADGYGGARLVEAKSVAQVNDLLSMFYAQKSERLHEQGVRGVFGGEETRQFLQQMAVSSLISAEPILQLFALEIGGKVRAICGGGVSGTHFSAYFTSFANDELAHISPGEMLLYMMVEHLSNSGFQYLDLGIGEERYKRSWCPDTFEMVDVIIPLSPAAYGHVFAERLALIIKRKVRENDMLWDNFKRSRVLVTKIADRIISS